MVMEDLLQMEKKLEKPEIRVWVHPMDGGDDCWHVFKSVNKAQIFIYEMQRSKHPDDTRWIVEDSPLIAYNGFEYTIDEFIAELWKRIGGDAK